MDKIRRSLGGGEADETGDDVGIMAEINSATTFSWTTRIKGFVICLVCGVVCSLLGTFFIAIPGTTGIRLFAVFYSIGNIMAISSTCFLMGPLNQLKRMFAETRIIATIVFLLFLVLTLLSGLLWKKVGLAILFCVLQFLSMIWYSLTYIPFARDAIKKCASSCIDI